MQITIDTDANRLTVQDAGAETVLDLFSKEAFDRLAELWVQLGWVRKYSYGFSWLGRPIIQLPDDMIRIQEAIFQVKPDVIVETGIAHGGSLVYYASVMAMLGQHPAAPSPKPGHDKAVKQRRPEKFPGVGELNQGKRADHFEVDMFCSQPRRNQI